MSEPRECRICDAAHNDPLDGVSERENDQHERLHVPPSTAHYLRSTGRVVRMSPGNRWVNRPDPAQAEPLPCGDPWCESCYPVDDELTLDDLINGLESVPPAESVTDEAYRLVMGPRQSDYNHPSDDFKATGRQWGALLTNWLHAAGWALTYDGVPGDVPDVPPRMVALMMAQLKLSRESHKPKRDNRVDAIGYILCADRVVEGY